MVDSGGTYTFEVIRKPGEAYGKAIGRILDPDGNEVARGPVVTGPKNKLDPAQYGGVTPPGPWAAVETLEKREHARGGDPFTYCRMIPLGQQRKLYPNRTYNAVHITDPFMVHFAGSSSGCVCIMGIWWDQGVQAFNVAFAVGLIIVVKDDPNVDLSEFSEAFDDYHKKYD